MPSPAAAPGPAPMHEAPLPPARTTAQGVRVHTGVVYADLPGVRPLELDLHLPPAGPGAAPAPLVVFVHGGGWLTGSRRSAGPALGARAFERVAAAGTAVASVDHRLSGEARWPAALHDVKAAVRFLRSRAAEFGLDAERTAAWGESAGGHLALLLGLTGSTGLGGPGGPGGPGVADLEGSVGVTGVSSRVDAVVAWYAPSDLARVSSDLGADPDDPTTREARLLGAAVTADPARTAQASPLAHVRPATAGGVPFLVLHGEDDRAVSPRQSERLVRALAGAGARVRARTWPGAGHVWSGSATAAAEAVEETVAFLSEVLGPPARP